MTYLTAEMRAQMDALPREGVKEYALDLLARELTEERTDALIAYLYRAIADKLPWWAGWAAGAIRGALDALLPDQLVAALRKALA